MDLSIHDWFKTVFRIGQMEGCLRFGVVIFSCIMNDRMQFFTYRNAYSMFEGTCATFKFVCTHFSKSNMEESICLFGMENHIQITYICSMTQAIMSVF